MSSNKSKTIAVYPGTFDPITNGHIDIIKRASKLFDHLIVAVAQSPSKRPLFDLNHRLDMSKRVLSSLSLDNKITVVGFNCLLINLCQQHQASVILRGLRAVSDFEYEFQLSGMNKQLDNSIETLFLPTCEKFSYLSSSLVKEVAKLNGDITNFVPDIVKAELDKAEIV